MSTSEKVHQVLANVFSQTSWPAGSELLEEQLVQLIDSERAVAASEAIMAGKPVPQ